MLGLKSTMLVKGGFIRNINQCYTSGVLYQKQVSRTGTSNYISWYLCVIITCHCPWYLPLAKHSTNIYVPLPCLLKKNDNKQSTPFEQTLHRYIAGTRTLGKHIPTEYKCHVVRANKDGSSKSYETQALLLCGETQWIFQQITTTIGLRQADFCFSMAWWICKRLL